MIYKMTRASVLIATLVGIFHFAGCATAPRSDEAKTDLHHTSSDTLDRALREDPTLRELVRNAVGYAVLPTIGKGAIGVGGAYGKGTVYKHGVLIGYCDMTQGSIGFQLGGQSYTEILVFENDDAIERFKNGNLKFDAQATAVAVKSGAGANAKFSNGVKVFSMNEAGLMYEASVGGQQFTYQSI